MNAIINPIVKILWIDAETIGDNGWQELEDLKSSIESPPPIMQTVGFLIGEYSTHISVTDSIGDKECGHLTKIPLCMIRSMLYLEDIDNG